MRLAVKSTGVLSGKAFYKYQYLYTTYSFYKTVYTSPPMLHLRL